MKDSVTKRVNHMARVKSNIAINVFSRVLLKMEFHQKANSHIKMETHTKDLSKIINLKDKASG